MLKLSLTTKFKKDLKRFKHQKKLLKDLDLVLALLVQEKPLPRKYVDHPLGGNWFGSWECHVHPDCLLIYRIDQGQGKLILERLGSHSELF